MTETIKDYIVIMNKDQEEINILGGTTELTEKELKEIAFSFGIENYQIHLGEVYSAKKTPEFQYFHYNLAYGPRSSYWNAEKGSVLKPENIEMLHNQFKTEADYRRVLQALRQTRKGLIHIHSQSPHYKDEIFKQMEAVNNLIGALIVDDLPHPWLEDPEENINDSQPKSILCKNSSHSVLPVKSLG